MALIAPLRAPRTSPARHVLARWDAAARRHPLTSADTAARRHNNFDAARLLAAITVLVSHAFAHAGQAQPGIGGLDAGTLAVLVFFGISGFLITQSWTIEPQLARYLAKRALRILPALIVLLLLTVLVLGPAFTALPLRDYFADPATWTYLAQNAVLTTTSELPGVFGEAPYPRQVNASLWTLAPEAWAYLAVAVAGLAGGLRRVWPPVAIAVIVILLPHEPTGLVPMPRSMLLLQAFAVGTCLYVLRDRIVWHGGIVTALLAAFALCPSTALQAKLSVAAIPYAAIWFAYRGPAFFRRLTARGDFSYGVYLYAWPVGQAVITLWPGAGTLGVLAVGGPLTYLLAVASWHIVERPALELKNRLKRRHDDPRAPAHAAPPPHGPAPRFARERKAQPAGGSRRT